MEDSSLEEFKYWVDPGGDERRGGYLGAPLAIYPPPRKLLEIATRQARETPTCVHDLWQTAQDYYMTLDTLCKYVQASQLDYAEFAKLGIDEYYGWYETPLTPMRPIDEELKALELGIDDYDPNKDFTEWLHELESVGELFSSQSQHSDWEEAEDRDFQRAKGGMNCSSR